MSRKPIEANYGDIYINHKVCLESEVRKLEAELKQLQKTIHNTAYTKLPEIAQIYKKKPSLTIDTIAEVLEAIYELDNFA